MMNCTAILELTWVGLLHSAPQPRAARLCLVFTKIGFVLAPGLQHSHGKLCSAVAEVPC